ncbi:hypothetical protein N752_28425 [Desulforamulus aquiferis]|nr:TIGR04086 family membrane protein [Desulforamulus aquiferis]RYD01785.1 hypothetical protein N752_28425 [Desulforamulus aquiferis]
MGIGIIASLSATLAVFLILAFVVAVTSMPIYDFALAIMLTMLVSSFLGGKGAGKEAGIRGCIHGAAVGLLYGMLFVFLSVVAGMPVTEFILIIGSMVLAGIIGGIVGVNLPNAKRQVIGRRATR